MKQLPAIGLLALAAACSPSPNANNQQGAPKVAASSRASVDPEPATARADVLSDGATQIAVSAPSPRPSASPTDTANPRSTTRDCYFKVDGRVLVSGRCKVFPMGDDQYTLNTWDSGKPAQSHFAVVTKDNDADATATATWNADPGDDHAMDPLGTVRRDGNCWVNERTRICVR
ncbi:hypothetical protein SAMN05216382_2477 [Sphingomonas palmae]|uniref:Lipoprotein n=1 Tax=Sphingomonas palmae TaxID=1855283 RepID=A0A1H7S8R4_9SPHN|nr:hypothetical protein [Sphingomonas palmae]SEL68699.1 hypothetical protein SAMN05216382_2477 [Sphingomonas palmae]